MTTETAARVESQNSEQLLCHLHDVRCAVGLLKRMLEDGARNPVAYKQMVAYATEAHEGLKACIGLVDPVPTAQVGAAASP